MIPRVGVYPQVLALHPGERKKETPNETRANSQIVKYYIGTTATFWFRTLSAGGLDPCSVMSSVARYTCLSVKSATFTFFASSNWRNMSCRQEGRMARKKKDEEECKQKSKSEIYPKLENPDYSTLWSGNCSQVRKLEMRQMLTNLKKEG